MRWLVIISCFLVQQTLTILQEKDFPEYLIQCLNFFGDYDKTKEISIYKFCWMFSDWIDRTNYTNTMSPEVHNYIVSLLGPFYAMQPTGMVKSIRKEYRMMTDRERENFHKAVRMLKYDTSVPPSKYDAIAILHTKLVAPGAHEGPSFPGWHRIYLVLFERAIQQMVPDAILPYWDSTLEGNMMVPENSVIFSDHFVGNGKGYVSSGPFRGFVGIRTGRLYRDVGKTGRGPISAIDAGNILNQEKTKDITFPSANLDNSLEQAHNEVHNWVGGQMGEIDTSADDPLFFVHHCFIDYLWSLFRLQQKENYINPEFDYPYDAEGHHHPLSTMKPFKYFKNINGYSDYWTDHVFTYEPSPYCTQEQPTCKSKWLTCDTVNWRCISAYTPFQENVEKSILNNFVINGVENKELWCYVTTEVLFGTFYDPSQYSYVHSTEDMYGNPKEHQLTSSKTECIQKDMNKIDIYVESDGVSYRGRFLEFIVFDKNRPLANTKLRIAMSETQNSTAYFSAFDSCGRVCSAYCLVYNSYPPEYQQCSGVITKRYGLQNYCTKDDQNTLKSSGYGDIPLIKFFCDRYGITEDLMKTTNVNIQIPDTHGFFK